MIDGTDGWTDGRTDTRPLHIMHQRTHAIRYCKAVARGRTHHFSSILPIALVRKVMRSVASVRPSVCLFRSLPDDLAGTHVFYPRPALCSHREADYQVATVLKTAGRIADVTYRFPNSETVPCLICCELLD